MKINTIAGIALAATLTLGMTGCASAAKQSDNQAAPTSQSQAAEISLDKAKEIALDDSKINAEDATFMNAELITENGKQVYDIRYMANSMEYDYKIDATSGAISSFDSIVLSISTKIDTTEDTEASN